MATSPENARHPTSPELLEEARADLLDRRLLNAARGVWTAVGGAVTSLTFLSGLEHYLNGEVAEGGTAIGLACAASIATLLQACQLQNSLDKTREIRDDIEVYTLFEEQFREVDYDAYERAFRELN